MFSMSQPTSHMPFAFPSLSANEIEIAVPQDRLNPSRQQSDPRLQACSRGPIPMYKYGAPEIIKGQAFHPYKEYMIPALVFWCCKYLDDHGEFKWYRFLFGRMQ